MAIKTCFYGLCLLGFGIWVAISPVQPALACIPTATPPGFPGFSLVDYVIQAQVIVEGTITAMEIYEDLSPSGHRFETDAAIIEVNQSLKGSDTDSIYIIGFGRYPPCQVEARIGIPMIFYATSNANGAIRIFRTESATETNIALIEEAIEQSHTSETALSVTTTTSTNNLWIGLFGVGLVALLLFILWSTKRTRRAPQP